MAGMINALGFAIAARIVSDIPRGKARG